MPPRSKADDAGLRDAGLYLQAKFLEMLGYESSCARFLLAKLGMLVDVAAPGDQLLLDLRGALADLLFQLRDIGLRARRRDDREHDCAENESGSDDVQHCRLPGRQD